MEHGIGCLLKDPFQGGAVCPEPDICRVGEVFVAGNVHSAIYGIGLSKSIVGVLSGGGVYQKPVLGCGCGGVLGCICAKGKGSVVTYPGTEKGCLFMTGAVYF